MDGAELIQVGTKNKEWPELSGQYYLLSQRLNTRIVEILGAIGQNVQFQRHFVLKMDIGEVTSC